VESGLLAAWTIIEAQGDYRAARLAPYLSRLRRRFGPGGSLAAAIPAGMRALFARGLFSHPRLLRRFVLDQRFLRLTQETLPQSPPAAKRCNARTVP
jgi:hypothetical protein